MKILVFKCSLLLLIMFGSLIGYGQTIEKSRKVTEVFKVGEGTEIEIINKYGNIHLIPWEEDSVKFIIELMVKGSKQSKVDKSFDYIEFDFKTSKYYIIAQTLFAGKSSFWSDVSDLTGAIFNSSTKTKIDYTVYIPSNAKLKVLNKYGNIYTTDHSGELEIQISNGDLKAHHLSGKTVIESEFGDANIEKMDNGNLTISYGELHLDYAEHLVIESKSSKFYIDKVADLELNSRRDKFYLGNVAIIKGASNFTLVEIDELISKFNLTTKYGDIDVKSFNDKTESFNINANDTDITLHFTDGKRYTIGATVDSKTEVMYSANIINITSKELDGKEKLIEVKCTIGNNNAKKVPINMDVRSGRVSLKLK